MKKITIITLSALLALTATLSTANNSQAMTLTTQEQIDTEYLDDGSYLITTTMIAPAKIKNAVLLAKTKNITKSKTANYYNASHTLLWSITLTGTFSYGNGSAKCTHANISTTSHNSCWKFSSKNCNTHGNQAIGSTTIKHYSVSGVLIDTVSKTLTLTCSSNGNFS